MKQRVAPQIVSGRLGSGGGHCDAVGWLPQERRQMTARRCKLVEVSMPLNANNRASAREKWLDLLGGE